MPRERLSILATIAVAVALTGMLFAIDPIRDAVGAAFAGDLGEMRAELDSLGALAALVLIDACVRLLPRVAGNEVSLADESFAGGLLEYPHYTRPRDWEGRPIPEVLLSGDHDKIAKWRREQAEKITKERRPDLLSGRKP